MERDFDLYHISPEFSLSSFEMATQGSIHFNRPNNAKTDAFCLAAKASDIMFSYVFL